MPTSMSAPRLYQRPSLDWLPFFSGQRRQETTSFHHIRALILSNQIVILDDVAAFLFYSLLLVLISYQPRLSLLPDRINVLGSG